MSFYSVGVTALNTAQLGLTTTGHNISNVNTEGYHRQIAVQATNIPIATGSGFIGQGVHVETVKRVYSQFLENQVQQAQTQSSYFNSYLGEINQIDNILADPTSGLSPALQDFFKAVNDVATNPQSVPSRQSMLSGASALISRFQTLDRRFTEIREGVNSQIASSVSSINSYAQQIAKLNEQILLQTGSTGQPPNDLLDQRDMLITNLSQLVRVTALRQDDGSLNIFIGNGQPLVIGQQAFTLSAVPSPEDPQRYEIGYKSGSNIMLLPQGSLSGGSLGGLLEFRSDSLDAAQNELGLIALTLAQTFNAQHRLGQDLNGSLGGDFFAGITPVVNASSSNNPASGMLAAVISDATQLNASDFRIEFDGVNYRVTDLASKTTKTVAPGDLATAIPGLTLTAPAPVSAGDVFTVQPTRFAARDIALSATINTSAIAAAAPIVVNAEAANTGSAKVVESGVTSVAGLPLGVTITLTYDAASNQFVVAGAVPAVANISYSAGSAMTINGITLTFTGIPADGDVFTISNNINGVSDNRNALLLAELQTANTMAGGTTSYQGAYSQLVSNVGNKTAEVQVMALAEENVLTQAKNSQQALSGVNLDEEAANLMRYQQAYQAAGKMLQIATTLFDTLLSIGS
jgi:flagellar hook-associated protein 1 FlgK